MNSAPLLAFKKYDGLYNILRHEISIFADFLEII